MYETAVCVFQPKATGEQKTKPTQASVRELRGLGLSPDIVSSFLLLLAFEIFCVSWLSARQTMRDHYLRRGHPE